jgi:hypothetical protein
MLIISDTESWSSSAPTQRLSNQLVWLKRNDTPTIIAIGAPHQWNSTLPLPSNSTVTDLVAASTTNPTLAALFWPAFLRHVHLASKHSLMSRVLLMLSFTRIPVQVAISDKEIRTKVQGAIFKNRSSQFRQVDF